MRDNLKHAMRVIDGEDAEARQAITAEAEKMLQATQAAHEARVASSAAIDDESERLLAERFALNEAEAAMTAAAHDAARKASETHADAVRVVQRAKAREGHDLTATRPADALAIDIIRRALDGVREASNVRQEDAFNVGSSSAEIAKGARVMSAIKGDA